MARARKPSCAECGRPLTRRDGLQACTCARKRKEARERAQLAKQRMEIVVRAVHARDPDVPAPQVRALVEEVAPKTTMLASIADHLESHPSALTDGGSRMPKVMAELIYRAIEHGVTGLNTPSCALCGRPRTLFHTYEDGQRICTSCYGRGLRETCSVCGRENLKIVKHAEDGGAICGRCRYKDEPDRECAGCGRVMAARRAMDGLYYCRRCASRRAPQHPCSNCGRTARANWRDRDRDHDQVLCTTCYALLRQARGVCDGCGRSAALVAREGGRSGHSKNLCSRCYRHPKRECGVCGRTRKVALRATETSPDVCPTCYWAPVVECSECGQQGLGRRTTRDGQPWCFACQAVARIDDLLTDETGRVRAGYDEVRSALTQVDPRSLLTNWGRTESLTLLARLLDDHGHVTHELLDREGSRMGVHYLRALLVSAGVLEERDEHMARLRTFCQEYVAEVEDAEMRQVMTRYARWHVVSRKRIGPYGLTATQNYNARGSIRGARRVLESLTVQGMRLDECAQEEIDRWAGDMTATTFLRWLQEQRLLARDLQVPEHAVVPSVTTGDPERQLALARRLLHDPASGSVEERAAGCLVLLYAQPLTKIVQLTSGDLIEHEGASQLRLGPTPLDLVPPLAELLRQLPIWKPFGAARELADDRWLFPGKSAGRPRHASSLMKSLNRQGIPARTSRNTAVYYLAGSVPPAVIASILGTHPNTAQKWAEQAGANWLNYGPHRT